MNRTTHSSPTYPTLQRTAKEAAERLSARDDTDALWLRDALLDIADRMRDWSATNLPAEEQRLDLVERLRTYLDMETALRQSAPGQ